MHSNAGFEKIVRPDYATATRFAGNKNWSYRGDNTKYRHKK